VHNIRPVVLRIASIQAHPFICQPREDGAGRRSQHSRSWISVQLGYWALDRSAEQDILPIVGGGMRHLALAQGRSTGSTCSCEYIIYLCTATSSCSDYNTFFNARLPMSCRASSPRHPTDPISTNFRYPTPPTSRSPNPNLSSTLPRSPLRHALPAPHTEARTDSILAPLRNVTRMNTQNTEHGHAPKALPMRVTGWAGRRGVREGLNVVLV
jgi:hypothetical protein